MLAPVWKKLTDDGYNVVFLALTTAQKYLAQQNIPYISFRDLPSNTDINVQKYGERLTAELSDGKISNDESIAYLGQSFRDLVLQHGEREAENIYSEHGRHAFLPVNTLKEAIQMIAPDVVVTTNSPRAERAAIMAAGACGIPSVCVVDLYPSKEIEWLRNGGFAQKICVLNDAVKDILAASGRPSEDVVVTGNPAFDRHYSFNGHQTAAKIRHDIFNNSIVVGLASNTMPATRNIEGEKVKNLPREVFERVHRLCSEKNYALALRQHPSEMEWADLGNTINCKSWSLDLYLASLDILITFPSTIALEAQIHGVRTGIINFSPLSQTSPYLFNGDFEVIQQIEDIDELTVSAEQSKSTAHKKQVSATQKICNVIINVT